MSSYIMDDLMDDIVKYVDLDHLLKVKLRQIIHQGSAECVESARESYRIFKNEVQNILKTYMLSDVKLLKDIYRVLKIPDKKIQIIYEQDYSTNNQILVNVSQYEFLVKESSDRYRYSCIRAFTNEGRPLFYDISRDQRGVFRVYPEGRPFPSGLLLDIVEKID